ncbi:MAG TPA: glycine betaine ABC transporter substrate-binding protein [Mycobacterium sp.]|nr:glycine betaine ABC transporter substrate-binding protein [Mycobacterium sp.]
MIRRAACAAVLIVVLTACGGHGGSSQSKDLVVGATSDPQSIVLANLYAAALRYFGTPAHAEVVADPLAALDAGKVDVVPGLTGRLLQTFAPGATARSDEQVYKAMVGALPEGITVGDFTTAAEDKPAVAVADATATAWGGRDLTSLVGHCAQVRPGARKDAQIPTAIGSCKLSPPRQFADSAALFAALRAGEINAAWTSTADPAMSDAPQGLVVLTDRKPMLIQAENAVPLYRRNELNPQQVLALNQIAGALDTAGLKQMRQKVIAGADPRAVADAWLADNPLGR